jgi:hypothetical protein
MSDWQIATGATLALIAAVILSCLIATALPV